MSFVKIDCKILDSTLWVDRDAREIFITALLMAVPWEIRSSVPQLDVKTMQPTGWEVPAGWYGLVEAAGAGIVRRAGLDQSDGEQALERLGQPDLGSRSDSYDGRRLVRINGGYLVLNYINYREHDHNAAERMRRFRERRRLELVVTGVTANSDAVTLNEREQSRQPSRSDELSHIADVDELKDTLHSKSECRGSKPQTARCSTRPPPCPHQAIVELYHEVLPMCPHIRDWKPAQTRARMLAARWREDDDRQDMAWWRGYFEDVRESRFLTGRGAGSNGRAPFLASLEWLVTPANFIKVYEGQYHE